jgi:hypothetical protein
MTKYDGSQIMMAYTEDYKTSCKIAWYNAGRPKSKKDWMDATPEDVHGRKPNPVILRNWKSEMMWDFWADDMDSRAMQKVEVSIVARRAKMFEKHADAAAKWQDAAWKHIQEEGFDSSASAVQAYFKAVEAERTSLGISQLMVKMENMDDSQLKEEFIRLINRGSENDQIIDVDEIPEKKEENIETESDS